MAHNVVSGTNAVLAAKKRTTRKKVSVKAKKKAARKKRAAPEVSSSVRVQALTEQVNRAQASVDTAKQRIADLQLKIKDARAKLKATGDGRARRTINSGADKLSELRQKAVEAAAKLRAAKASLQVQIKTEAAEAKRDAALAAAVKKFKAKWLRDYERAAASRGRRRRRTAASK